MKKMNEADGFYADENDMPNVDDDYNNVSLESIKTFSVAMFKHWTDDEFAARFRRMLSLERFKNSEMAELYKSYISSGPLDYMKEVFAGMNYSDETAAHLANIVRSSSSLENNFYIWACSGTDDVAYDRIWTQVQAMAKFTDVFDVNHLTFHEQEGAQHEFRAIAKYLYNALPSLFSNRQKTIRRIHFFG